MLRGEPWCYVVPTLVLPSAYQNTFIQHSYNTKFIQHVYTTRQYNTQIGKLSGKEKLAFIVMIKGGTYIQIGLGFSLYSLTKLTRRKKEGTEKQIKLQTGKEVIHQPFALDE